MIQDLLQINWQIFEAINQPAGHQPLLDKLMVFGAKDVIFLLPLLLLALWAAWARWSPLGRAGAGGMAQSLGQRLVLLTCVAVVLALCLNILLSAALYEPRPFVSHPRVVHLLIAHAADASFPSDHEAVAAAMATMLVAYLFLLWRERRTALAPTRSRGRGGNGSTPLALGGALAAVGVLGAIFIGVARVYVGVHYPGDILGGATCGAVSGIFATSVRPLAEPALEPLVRLAERLRLA
jgi:undecaprenyl-diphosphatase